MQIRPTAFTIGLIIYSFIALFFVYTEFGIDSSIEVSELCILVTDEDVNGENILAMSDFFSGYLNQLKTEIRTNGALDMMSDIPISDFGIIADVINQAEA